MFPGFVVSFLHLHAKAQVNVALGHGVWRQDRARWSVQVFSQGRHRHIHCFVIIGCNYDDGSVVIISEDGIKGDYRDYDDFLLFLLLLDVIRIAANLTY